MHSGDPIRSGRPPMTGTSIAPSGRRQGRRVALRQLLGVALLAAALAPMPAATPALAVEPDEKLDDPQLEQRARDLSEHIRCLVCQNESIDESNADLAKDLRLLVRERIKEGQSDAQIKDYLTDRYGDFVLLKPPMKPETYALWYGPAVVVAAGVLGVAVYFRRRAKQAEKAQPRLSPEEERRLQSILEGQDDKV
jgi:cytochrome c-type biogenesis protein CcmH